MKLGEKGQYPNGTNGSMAKGDKVYLGVNTAAGDPMSFILLVNETYNTYQLTNTGGVYSLDTSVPNITGWFAMGNEVYSDIQRYTTFPSTALTLYYGSSTASRYHIVENSLTTEPTSMLATQLSNFNSMV